MSDYSKLQTRCQRGEASLAGANNLLAESHAALGRLIAERDQLLGGTERLKAENEALRQFILGFSEYDAEMAYAYTAMSMESSHD